MASANPGVIQESTYSRCLTLLVLAAAVAEFLPQHVLNIWHLEPAMGERLRMGMLYAFGIAVIWTVVLLKRCCNGCIVALFWKDKLILFALFSISLSVAVNGSLPRPMLLFATVCTFFVFRLLPMCKVKADPTPIAILLVVLTVTPLILHLAFGFNANSFVSESFRGFFDGRTSYAFASGLALLLVFLINNKIAYITLPFVSAALALSGSRSGMLAFTVASIVLYFHFQHLRRRRHALLLTLIVIWVWVSPAILLKTPVLNDIDKVRVVNVSNLWSISNRSRSASVGLFADTYNRRDIYKSSLQAISDDRLGFGHGDYYQTVSVRGTNIEPHNNILQSLLNFGLFVTLSWLFLLSRLVRQISIEGRALLSFWFCFGFFQPGFDAFLFIPASMIVLVLANR
jgi:hypothetical protein